MKFGILLNRNNINIGDDIQAYATARFYPRVDYLIDREDIDSFRTQDGKPVAVIMNAWYMWKKWNWPPSQYVYPLFVGFHYADHQRANQPGSLVKYEFLTGEGGRYLNSWGPVGCRDHFTEKQLKAVGVDAYFSGCITLTLPKQKKEDRGKYICVVDVDERVTAKIRQEMKGSGIEVRVMTHNQERNLSTTWEQREAFTIERLTEYQNAICVVTKRLHCALPCLAMEVPVLLVKGMSDDIRFDPYYSFLHWVKPEDYLNGRCSYDLKNPPANKPDYRPVRESMIKKCTEFVSSVKDDERRADETAKYHVSEKQLLEWRIPLEKAAIDGWEKEIVKRAREYSDMQKKRWETMKQTGEYKREYSLLRRLKHRFYILTDATYKNQFHRYRREMENLHTKLAANSATGISRLRYEDLVYRGTCNGLLWITRHLDWKTVIFSREIERMKNGISLAQQREKEMTKDVW